MFKNQAELDRQQVESTLNQLHRQLAEDHQRGLQGIGRFVQGGKYE